ncbi:hypothetical protein Ddc_12954 [Ditylenchus destructor]|nr:hypothetical protein Ddc_12954 [Ditylenchus destructor]
MQGLLDLGPPSAIVPSLVIRWNHFGQLRLFHYSLRGLTFARFIEDIRFFEPNFDYNFSYSDITSHRLIVSNAQDFHAMLQNNVGFLGQSEITLDSTEKPRTLNCYERITYTECIIDLEAELGLNRDIKSPPVSLPEMSPAISLPEVSLPSPSTEEKCYVVRGGVETEEDISSSFGSILGSMGQRTFGSSNLDMANTSAASNEELLGKVAKIEESMTSLGGQIEHLLKVVGDNSMNKVLGKISQLDDRLDYLFKEVVTLRRRQQNCVCQHDKGRYAYGTPPYVFQTHYVPYHPQPLSQTSYQSRPQQAHAASETPTSRPPLFNPQAQTFYGQPQIYYGNAAGARNGTAQSGSFSTNWTTVNVAPVNKEFKGTLPNRNRCWTTRGPGIFTDSDTDDESN